MRLAIRLAEVLAAAGLLAGALQTSPGDWVDWEKMAVRIFCGLSIHSDSVVPLILSTPRIPGSYCGYTRTFASTRL